MTKKIILPALCSLLCAPCSTTEAQQRAKIPRIGYVSANGDPNNPGPQVEAFRRELQDLGYVEGKNILIEFRYGAGKSDRIPSLVNELVQLKVDLLFLAPQPAIRAAKPATKTIPIVMVTTQNPVAAGFVDGAFQAAANGGSRAVITITNNLLFRNSKRITDLAIKNRLPSMYEGRTWVEAGGLMSYSANDLEVFRRVATYVDKILKGAKPAELPIEQPTKFELVINLKTAKQIGVTIPQSMLYRADKVIK